jgi:hypothetical protein
VFPGVPGAAHLHEFFGNTSTNASSTYATMIGKPTTCSVVGDTAGYWVPALLNGAGQRIAPRRINVYYRDRPPASRPVTPFPPDFRMIAGSPQAGVWGFNCDDIALAPTSKIDCTGYPTPYVRATIVFPELRAGGRPREHREGLRPIIAVMSRTRSRRRWNTWNQLALTDLVRTQLNS